MDVEPAKVRVLSQYKKALLPWSVEETMSIGSHIVIRICKYEWRNSVKIFSPRMQMKSPKTVSERDSIACL